ncbi:MAG: HRDC domain-containing protein [Verrucomicrobiota bacterium]
MIDSQTGLDKFLPQLKTGEILAVDTEADSLHAYPEKLCLIQVSHPSADLLIDPLADLDLRPLLEVLQSKQVILHGADYDLRLLHRTFQFVPAVIFDTMWAARLLGFKEFGLQALVRDLLGVALEKGPQKANWALRPLPARMAAYALNDTRFLMPLAKILQEQLAAKGRLEWFAEVCAKVIRESSRPREVDPDTIWRVKGSDRLDRPAMAILRELWRWRELEARESNKPPYFVMSHEKLVAISAAASQGRPVQDLMPPRFSAKRAGRLGVALQHGLELPASMHPRPRRSFAIRLTRPQQLEFDRLKEVRDRAAGELMIDPTLIASKAELLLLARNPSVESGELMRWQRHLLRLSV